MLYIICAFEAEARVLIDSYKLIKKQTTPFTLFENSEIRLVISLMGPEKAASASKYLISSFSPKRDDSFLNLGICAAQKEYPIGKLLQIKTLTDGKSSYTLETLDSTIKSASCYSSNETMDTVTKTDIAEMEALALYENISSSFHPENISFVKVVSDHFKPFKPSKQFVIDLIRNNLTPIQKHITLLTGTRHAQ